MTDNPVMDKFYDPTRGTHNPCSNFFRRDPITIRGLLYPTLEHWYQAMKTLNPEQFEEIRLSPTPGQAKRLGRACDLRVNWEEVKLPVMREGLEAKFTLESFAGKFLIDTGEMMLIEGNDWGDKYWGKTYEGEGDNWLGILLMARRAELRWHVANRDPQCTSMAPPSVELFGKRCLKFAGHPNAHMNDTAKW